jgi:hypothetical protein
MSLKASTGIWVRSWSSSIVRGRKAEIPLGGSRQRLDSRVAQHASEQLGLDWSQLPGPKSQV